MKPIIIIDTFKTIFIPSDKKPIVICDIDHTFIRPARDQIVNDMLHMSLNVGLVKQTDKEGFQIMLQKIYELGGKFLFLTARSSVAHHKTIKDLLTVGLENPEQFEIHYTGNEITKGHYIKRHNLLQGYDHHIFIDDYPHFLESALQLYPDMNAYLFKYNQLL